MSIGHLRLQRENNEEVYSLKVAEIRIDQYPDSLDLIFYAATAHTPLSKEDMDDNAGADVRPNALVKVRLSTISSDTLVGREFLVPLSYDESCLDYFSSLYYHEHLEMNDNVIRVLECRGNDFLVQWTGTTNGIDGKDKPLTKVDIHGWFKSKLPS